ncbi:hypothetical protein Q7P37_007197 [Cladosporium fusiforme]
MSSPLIQSTNPTPHLYSSAWSPVLLVAIIPLLTWILYQRFFHPLASIPGPFLASITRLWITKHSWDGDMNTTMIALHKKHGPLVRTGPNELSVSDLAAIKTIYGAGTQFRKSKWYSVWQGHRKFDLFAERDEKIHASQRRLVSRAYSMEALRDLEPHVNTAIEIFLSKMSSLKNSPVDMGKWTQLFAFDVIGELTFSKSFGFMQAGTDDGSFAQIETALKSAAWIGQVPWLYWLHDALSPYIGSHLGIAARHGSLRTTASNEITARQTRGSDRNDILSSLMTAQKIHPNTFDSQALTSMATSNIFAGSDTTAISTRAIIYHLLKNPSSKAKLLAELDAARKKARSPPPPASLAEADRLPYLQAVMHEALRLHPAVGMSLPRVSPHTGATVAGRFIPAGTTVGANPWVIHRDVQVFGDDVEAFRPERWVAKAEDEAKSQGSEKGGYGDMQRLFFAFGAGARMCLGRNISWMEMSKLIPTLFLHYDLELVEPEKEWETHCWWFVMQKGLNVRLTPREPMQ